MAEFLRASWNAAPPKHVGDALHLEPYGAVHDIGGGPGWPSNVAATLKAIQAEELAGEYVDIAYNTGVDQNGNEWELRGDVSDGATKGYAGQSFSVLAICNASAAGFVPSPAMLSGIARAFVRAQQRGVLAANAYIDSHHWFDSHVTSAPTACCGPPLIAAIPQIRQLMVGTAPAPPVVIPPPKPQTGGTLVNMPNVKAKLITLTNIVPALGLFSGTYDAGVPVAECGATLHGPAPHAVAPGSTDDWWGSSVGASVRAQARGNHVVVTANLPNWKAGDPMPAAHVQAFLA